MKPNLNGYHVRQSRRTECFCHEGENDSLVSLKQKYLPGELHVRNLRLFIISLSYAYEVNSDVLCTESQKLLTNKENKRNQNAYSEN